MANKRYTLIAEQHFSGATPIKIGDKIKDLSGLQVSRFLKNGSAKFKTEKEHEDFIKEFKDEVKQKEETEAKAKALLQKEQLQNELISICTDAVKKAAEVEGTVLEDEEILSNVEKIIKLLKK